MTWFTDLFINEAKAALSGRGGVSKDVVENIVDEYLTDNAIKGLVEEYLDENPPVAKVTINGEEPDENGNFVVEIPESTGDKNVVVL